MAEVLLLNPRRRRKSARKSSAKRRRVRRNPIAAVARRPRRNPIANLARRRRRVRRNPIALRRGRRGVSRRRRNPIGISTNSIVNMLINGAVGGAGAIAVDVAWARLNGMLPATIQTQPGRIGVGNAVKAVLTAALGGFLNRYTKGLASKAAAGALAVQARDAMAAAMPSLAMAGVAGLGYAVPGRVVNATARIGPNRALNNNGAGQRVGAYLPPGVTPLLNGSVQGGVRAYMPPGVTALLNGRGSASQREGFRR